MFRDDWRGVKLDLVFLKQNVRKRKENAVRRVISAQMHVVILEIVDQQAKAFVLASIEAFVAYDRFMQSKYIPRLIMAEIADIIKHHEISIDDKYSYRK